MKVTIAIDAVSLRTAEALVPTIGRANPFVSSAAHVLSGAVTVGLNRLLSRTTFNPRTLRALLRAREDVAAEAMPFELLDADGPRVARVLATIGDPEVAPEDVICSAARTGLCMLGGVDSARGPIACSYVRAGVTRAGGEDAQVERLLSMVAPTPMAAAEAR